MSQSLFFEGPEKKLEIQFKGLDLLSFPKSYWENLVDLTGAKILSEIANEHTVAYLLSESSLFVWKDRIVLITCGETKLIKAAVELYEKFKDNMTSIFFERKNEYQPVSQKTSALDDMSRLGEIFGGEAYRFGRLDDHYVYIFNQSLLQDASNTTFGDAHTTASGDISDDTLNYTLNYTDEIKTLELLIYGLKGDFKDKLEESGSKTQEFVKAKFEKIFDDYKLDQFFFTPSGYSLNGLCGSKYITIHITPQGDESYFSFEMDEFDPVKDKKIIKSLLDLCSPTSFDLIYFAKDKSKFLLEDLPYQVKQRSQEKVSSGYNINYAHYFGIDSIDVKAVKI